MRIWFKHSVNKKSLMSIFMLSSVAKILFLRSLGMGLSFPYSIAARNSLITKNPPYVPRICVKEILAILGSETGCKISTIRLRVKVGQLDNLMPVSSNIRHTSIEMQSGPTAIYGLIAFNACRILASHGCHY